MTTVRTRPDPVVEARRLFGRTPAGTLVSNCEPGHDWLQTEGGEGALTADTTDFRFGTQSLKITSTNNARIRASLDTVPDVDFLNGGYLGWWLYVPDPSTVQNLYIHVSTEGGAVWTRHFTESRLKTGWQFLHFGRNMSWANFETGATIGDFTGPFRRLQFRLESKVGQTASVSVDMVKAYRNELGGGMVSLMFDDALASHYTVARRVLDEVGFRGMSFVTTDWVGTAGKMTVAQLQHLDDIGWDVCTHSMTHTNLTTLSEAQIDTELAGSKTFLEDNDLYRGASFVAFPQNAWDATVMKVARRYYAGIRGGNIPNGNSQYLPFPQQVSLASRPADDGSTVADVTGWVDEAQRQGTWLSFYLHEVTAGGSATDPTTEAGLRAIVEHIAASGLPVVTYSDLQIKFPAPA